VCCGAVALKSSNAGFAFAAAGALDNTFCEGGVGAVGAGRGFGMSGAIGVRCCCEITVGAVVALAWLV